MASIVALKTYKAKRNFAITPEPAEGGKSSAASLQFVLQKHWATRLHYDFRLEFDGVMLSWAVPKGPSFDAADKRMAVHVEDHPITARLRRERFDEGRDCVGQALGEGL